MSGNAAESEWPVSTTWKTLGIHWHGYTSQAREAGSQMEDRRGRLGRQPDVVHETPEGVASWLEEQCKRYSRATSIDSVPPKRAKDDRDFGDSYRVNLSLASKGESLHTGVRLTGGQVDFSVEAVSTTDCDCGSAQAGTVSRLSKLGKKK